MRPNNDSRYASGVVSGVVLVVSIGLIFRAMIWVWSHQQPEAFIHLVTRPMFSIADVVGAVLALLVVLFILSVPMWAPRP